MVERKVCVTLLELLLLETLIVAYKIIIFIGCVVDGGDDLNVDED